MNILEKAKKIECKDCSNGVKMCQMRPCWGTVDDFKKIITAGYAKKLMIDYYNHNALNNGKRVYFLSGASNYNECSKADWDPRGACLLLENGKCIINAIKPTMGSIMCCKKEIEGLRYLHACLKTWTTQEGIDLIEDWKKKVDYIEKDDDEGFSLIEGMNLMLGY
jgi:hypothetical protein